MTDNRIETFAGEERCECGAVVPPGETLCELCGMREQIGALTTANLKLEEANGKLRERNGELAFECAMLKRKIEEMKG